ncbi:hypothetical protein CFAM422_012204 [Trichoderma lentiforme]|uniref:F-box domain-containing protein n=1 Tax=Trichoderma lentiforme TaxID=1567552 RepID=A0A9P5C7W4_9HYPO|nr:hypothetical protein CFAM422_012204 [Trichoderma lentiforme]
MGAPIVVKVGAAYQQPKSRLMGLPQELRLMIYAFLFSSTRFTSGERCGWDMVIRHFIPAPHGLAILISCRQAYIEIGRSWIGRVLFCFETVKAMVDKLADIPLETRSMIRHIRVSGHPMTFHYSEGLVQYDTYQVLKLLSGLKLDRLTVCGTGEAQSSYDSLNCLVKYSDGWKELHYKSHTSGFIGYKVAWLDELDELIGENRFLREPQPGGWQRTLEDRDGSNSGASVTIYRSNIPYLDVTEPYISNKGTWTKFTQELAPDQDIEEYQDEEDARLMADGEIEKEMLVVVKRGRGVDYEEKQGSPYLEQGDIREELPGKTWAEIKASEDIVQEISCERVRYMGGDDIYQETHVDLVDDYTHVDDYVWPVTHAFRYSSDSYE